MYGEYRGMCVDGDTGRLSQTAKLTLRRSVAGVMKVVGKFVGSSGEIKICER